MKRKTEFFFSIQNADEEKRLVSGVSDSGEPNGSGLLLDYETSKAQLIAWSANIEKKTNGASKGILRVMHRLETIGKIVALEFDDEKRHILVTTHVSDETAWEKIKAGEYTGFSWSWRTVGAPWKNEDATKKHGRPIYSYTGRPIELSIVDAPNVPGSDFTSIQNVDFPEEGDDMDENTESGIKVENGIYTAGKLGEILESLSWTQRAIAGEEAKEGDAATIPEELKGIVADLAAVWSKYSTAQAEELGEELGFDLFVDDEDEFDDLEKVENSEGFDIESDNLPDASTIQNGDYPGHPFRGNQHTGGKGRGKGGRTGAHHKASLAAHRASVRASKGGGGHEGHRSAAKAHKQAASLHAAKGNKRMAEYHKTQAKFHANEVKLRTAAKSYQNADGAPVQNAGQADAFSMIKELSDRIAALEAAPVVKNAEDATDAEILANLAAQNAPVVKNAEEASTTSVVTKDEDNGISVKNAETERRALAETLADLPEPERQKALAGLILKASHK